MHKLKIIVLIVTILFLLSNCSNQTFPAYSKCRTKCEQKDFLCFYAVGNKVPPFNNFFFCTSLSEGCYKKCNAKAGKNSYRSSSHSGGGGRSSSGSNSGSGSSSSGGSGGSSHQILTDADD